MVQASGKSAGAELHLASAGTVPEAIEGVICDLDGVVYRGDAPIESAVQALRRWRAAGIPYAFVTNNATKSAAQFQRKLNGLGVEVAAADIVNAVSATVSLLQRRWQAGTRVFAIGEAALFEGLASGGFRSGGDDAEVVVLGFDYELTYAKLRTAVRAALNGAAVVVTNPDPLTPADDGFEPCVGALMAAITCAVPTVQPIVVGKPEPLMIEEALGRLGTRREATIMIGDQLATDIVAGQRAGLRSVLVTTGVPQAPTAGVRADAIVSSLLEFRIVS